MKRLKYNITESNYKLGRSIIDWFSLFLACLILSIITFGIVIPFMTIYVIKTFIGSIEVDKIDKTYKIINNNLD